MKEKIALIFGGKGVERGISEISAENLCRMIDTDMYEIIPIGISNRGEWYIYRGDYKNISGSVWLSDTANLCPTFPVKMREQSGFLAEGEIISVCCAIPCLHGNFGEDGVIQGALAAAHIEYVGQDVYASAMTSDKAYTKLVAEHLGIPTAKWVLLTESDSRRALSLAEAKVGFPMFLKPARLGSSIGAQPVYDFRDFARAYREAYTLDGRVLVEKLIPIKYELECAYLSAGSKANFAPYGKIFSGGAFYDYSAKYDGKNTPKISADGVCTAVIEATARDYAAKLVGFIGMRDLARVDFFVTENGQVYFNEINAFPGMTEASLYPQLTERMGFKKGEFINLLIRSASDRRI